MPGDHLATSFSEASQIGMAHSDDGCMLIVRSVEYAVILPIRDLRNVATDIFLSEVCSCWLQMAVKCSFQVSYNWY